MPRLRSVVAWLAITVLAVLAYVAGFGAASKTIQATNRNVAAQVAVAQRAMEEAQQEAEQLADELDLLEEDLWAALAEQPAPKSETAKADELLGKVVGVADGDTITVLDSARTQHRVRLLGIDAPEKQQPFSTKAKEALSGKVFGKDVLVKWSKKDQYGRVLGDVKIGERWINLELVKEGFAWHFTQYDTRAELATAEKEARQAKRGLWVEDKPEAPWDYRARMRKPRPPPAATPQLPDSKEAPKPPLDYWINLDSGVRHNSGCRWFHNTKHGRPCGPNEGRACGHCGG